MLKFDNLQIFKLKIIIILSFNADTISYFRTNFTLILFIRLNCIKMTPCFCINWFRIFYIVFFFSFSTVSESLNPVSVSSLKTWIWGSDFWLLFRSASFVWSVFWLLRLFELWDGVRSVRGVLSRGFLS